MMIIFVVAISGLMIVITTYGVIRECIEGFSNELTAFFSEGCFSSSKIRFVHISV